MQQEVKLVVAEGPNNSTLEFVIFQNQKVGSGTYGVVKKAIRSDRPQQLLVVKIISYKGDKQREKIQKEINVLKVLPPHPNLVRVEPLKCFSQNNYYIFMECCPDGTLETLRKKKRNIFSEQQIFNIFYQLMRGYKVLYDAKILHQDIKPDNVLVTGDLFKLTDFGFSIYYEGFQFKQIREGTISYMPLQKLTQKQLYASTKIDVYAFGVMFFYLIVGHHPYINKFGLSNAQFVKELRNNELALRPSFFSKFSLKFRHLFDLILKMIAKKEADRVDFDAIYQYIENEEYFQQIRSKLKDKQKSQVNEYRGYTIVSESVAIAIEFDSPHHKPKEADSREDILKNEILNEIDEFIVRHRVMVYYFDRLTRRLLVYKIRAGGRMDPQEAVLIEKVILGLLVLCRRIVKNIQKEYKTGNIFSIASWKIYRKSQRDLLKLIDNDDEYLEDLIIEAVKLASNVKITQKQSLLKERDNLESLTQTLGGLLGELLSYRILILKPDDRANLVTICYIKQGIQILQNFQAKLKNALELETYFRKVESQKTEDLFVAVTNKMLNEKIDFSLDLGEDDPLA